MKFRLLYTTLYTFSVWTLLLSTYFQLQLRDIQTLNTNPSTLISDSCENLASSYPSTPIPIHASCWKVGFHAGPSCPRESHALLLDPAAGGL